MTSHSTSETLEKLVAEDVAKWSATSWAVFAEHIRDRYPAPAGETYGCEIDGRYIDAGIRLSWLDEGEGDIEMVCFASTPDLNASEGRLLVEQATVIPEP